MLLVSWTARFASFVPGVEVKPVIDKSGDRTRNSCKPYAAQHCAAFTHLPRQDTHHDIQGKRIFIKDIIHYLFPPDGKPASIAPSLCKIKRGVGTASETVTTNGVHSQNGVADGVNGHASGVDVNGASNGFHHGGDVDTTRNGVHEAFADGKSAGNASAPYPYETEPEPGNPTVVPQDLLARFHFAFLIRDPHYSVASYYRCTIPPLVEVNGWNEFDPSEAGYNELRRMFDYLRRIHQIGPRVATRDDLIVDETADAPKKVHHANGNANGVNSTTTTGSTPYEDSGVEICVVDADDLLEKPAEMIQAFCRSVGLPYDPTMLQWSSDEDQQYAREVFEKWRGFHDDAINSSELKARQHVSTNLCL